MTLPTRLNEGFTLIELVMVIIVLGILAAVAVPRLPDTGLFRDQFDANQVISGLNRARAHAVASQCHVLAHVENGALTARVAANCDTLSDSEFSQPRDFSDSSSNLAFIQEALSGDTGVTDDIRLVFTPRGEARELDHSDFSSVNVLPGEDLSLFSGGTLDLNHASGRTIRIDDATGYVR